MNKKILLTLATVIAYITPNFAASEKVGNYTWTYHINGETAEIVGDSVAARAVSPSPIGKLVIPSQLGGKPVVKIGRLAFGGCDEMYSIDIPNCVQTIEEGAFWACRNLISVVVPAGVRSIGNFAFANCDHLQKVIIPHTVVNIGSSAFHSCSSLALVVICNGVVSIGEGAFYGTGIECITIPRSVTEMGNGSFSCSNIKVVIFKGDAPVVGKDVFNVVNSPGVAFVSKGSTGWGVEEGDLWNCLLLKYSENALPTDGGAVWALGMVDAVIEDFSYWDDYQWIDSSLIGATSIVLNASMTNIGVMEFCACSNLREILIPNSVTNIGDAAFGGCGDLVRVIFKGDAPNVGDEAFSNVAEECTVYVPRNSKGWGVDIPGMWNGLRIEYSDESDEYYMPVTYHVVFDSNGGSGAMLAQTFTNSVESSLATNEFSFKGGEFAGWATNANGNVVFTNCQSITVKADMTLYAKWAETADDLRYLVIDLSGGANAVSYPVSYLPNVPSGGWTDEYKTNKLVLRKIPAGSITMGCETSEVGYTGEEAAPHEVTISQEFYIGVFEITQKQYELVTGNAPSTYKGDARPVEQVSWNDIRGNSAIYNWPNSSSVDASTFMGKLRAKTGIMTLDLPTEAKWEYACRAGTTSAFNSGKNLLSGEGEDANMNEIGRYSYNNGHNGGIMDGQGGYSENHTTVGSYLPNAWGLYDMHGNVWEWCLDWYQGRESLSSAAVTDPMGPVSGSCRVPRGGGWYSVARYCRSATRYHSEPYYKNYGIGFRLSCSVKDETGEINGNGVCSEGFIVTQYLVPRYQLRNIAEAEAAMINSALWLDAPVTNVYQTLSFSDMDYDETFKHVPYPCNEDFNTVGFALEAMGRINVSESGDWTFACGSDDGFKVTISGNGVNETFACEVNRTFGRNLKTIRFPMKGVYDIRLVHFEYWGGAEIDFSVAKGAYISFNPKVFRLVGDPESGITIARRLCVSFFNRDDVIRREYKYGEVLGELPQPAREGYVFAGWLMSDESGECASSNTVVCEDVAFYARWKHEFALGEGSEWTEASDNVWQSGETGDNAINRIAMSVNGRGTVMFDWKTSCESFLGHYRLDYLAFFVDDVEVGFVNGETDWRNVSFVVEEDGHHTFSWAYVKNEEGSAGNDCAWFRNVAWLPSVFGVPSIAEDSDAVMTGDEDCRFVVRPSMGKEDVVVVIPDGVNASNVTVEVSSSVKTVESSGAIVKVIANGYDITEYLSIPAVAGGILNVGESKVKSEIADETLDVAKGAKIAISQESPSLTTANTRAGLTYTLVEGVSLDDMKNGDSKVGDGEKWSPTITVKGGASGFYSIKVEK